MSAKHHQRQFGLRCGLWICGPCSGPLPSGEGWAFELKWDGFRALVSTEDGLRVRSRRGWNMTELLPELRGLPAGVVLDGELVAWRDGDPYFPDVCARVLNRDASIPITFVAYDVLRMDGKNMMDASFEERRTALVRLPLRRQRPSSRRRSLT